MERVCVVWNEGVKDRSVSRSVGIVSCKFVLFGSYLYCLVSVEW